MNDQEVFLIEEAQLLAYLVRDPQPCVMATIISVKGHAYRKEGSFMLLYENGETIGSISPGCLEADLMERVSTVLHSGEIDTASYDMSNEDDPLWGGSVGCGGEVVVLLEPVVGNYRQCLIEVAGRLSDGESVRLKRRFSGNGTTSNYELTGNAAGSAKRFLLSGDVMKRNFAYSQHYLPKPRLIIFGAGNDARYLSQLAHRIGFEIVVADWRSGLCTRERFPDVSVQIGEPDQLLQMLHLSNRDYVVVMSHHMERDRKFLTLLAGLSVRYVGIMGSAVRVNRLLQNIQVPACFNFPVGLPIGAVGAEEIAVSIVAELICVRRLESADVRNVW